MGYRQTVQIKISFDMMCSLISIFTDCTEYVPDKIKNMKKTIQHP